MLSTSQDEFCPECNLSPIRGIKEFGRSPTRLSSHTFDCPSCGLFDPDSEFRLSSEVDNSAESHVREILIESARTGEPGGGGGSTGKSKPKPKPLRAAAIYEDDPLRWNGNSAYGVAEIQITRLTTKDKSTMIHLPGLLKSDLKYVAEAKGTSMASLVEEAISQFLNSPDLEKVHAVDPKELRIMINHDRMEVLKVAAKARKMTFSGLVCACVKKFLESMTKSC